MLAYIEGTILAKNRDSIIVKAESLGYKVRLKPIDFSGHKKNQKIKLYLHSHVREDAFDLYGFKTLDELNFFEKLLSVSGIGPKTGLAILCLGSVAQITKAIEMKDTSFLTKVSGIGKKKANRLILELQGQLATDLEIGAPAEKEEALCALIELGYKRADALKALAKVKSKDPAGQVKEALKQI